MVFLVATHSCESWTVKKAEHQRIDAFELWCCRRLLRVLWTARRSNQSILKGNQPWIGRTDAEAPILWSSDTNSWLIEKDPDTGKDWGLKEKRASEDELAGWYHQGNEYELGQIWGDGEGQGGLACCSPWGGKELDMIRWLSNNSAYYLHPSFLSNIWTSFLVIPSNLVLFWLANSSFLWLYFIILIN